MPVKLTIIILSYQSKEHLEALLPSIWQSEAGFEYEVIVVDNGSTDGTYEWLRNDFSGRKNHYAIKNGNTGFAKGNNLGIRKAHGEYLLILNPDTKLESNTLSTMVKFIDSRPDVGMAGCKIIKPDGKLDLACRRRFPNPWNSFKRLFLLDNIDYNYSGVDINQEMEVDSIVGAFMMVRKIGYIGKSEESPYVKATGDKSEDRKSIEYAENGFPLFDESFFMYGEDLDYCWRCKEAGYKVWYYPKTFITHYKGASSRKVSIKALRWFYDAMWIFYKKHYKRRYPFILNWIVWLGIKLRMWMLIIVNSLRSNPRVSR